MKTITWDCFESRNLCTLPTFCWLCSPHPSRRFPGKCSVWKKKGSIWVIRQRKSKYSFELKMRRWHLPSRIEQQSENTLTRYPSCMFWESTKTCMVSRCLASDFLCWRRSFSMALFTASDLSQAGGLGWHWFDGVDPQINMNWWHFFQWSIHEGQGGSGLATLSNL